MSPGTKDIEVRQDIKRGDGTMICNRCGRSIPLEREDFGSGWPEIVKEFIRKHESCPERAGPILAVDFDGTLVEHAFPGIGRTKEDVVARVIRMQEQGWRIVLWSCRDGESLREAARWCEQKGIRLAAVNENVFENRGRDFGSAKIFADLYLDDRNAVCSGVKARDLEEIRK